MLARLQVNNTTADVYTCPSGKTSYVYVDISSDDGSSVNMTVQVGDGTTFYTYWTGSTNFLSVSMVLTNGDVIRGSTNGVVNVFVHGREM